jgi:mannose-1-phosphate guanylyltransferase
MLQIFGDQTLFEVAVNRLQPLMDPNQIFVVTVEDQAKILSEQVPSIPENNYILEPGPRGTASVVGLAAIHLSRSNPECVIAILTADHYIADEAKFQELLKAARELALEEDLVTLGITPKYADTGYGYIHRGEKRGEYAGFDAYHVRSFKEKPDYDLAEEYVRSGEYAWNSGMFVWKAESILAEIERQMPDLFRGLQEIDSALGTENERETIARVWSGLESQTVDFGIMEGARKVSVIPADNLGWCDVGGWARMFEVIDLDQHGNLIQAKNCLAIETVNTLLYQDESTTSDRLIVALGTEDLIVVDMGDVLFVCPKDKAEGVRKVVKFLNENGLDQYL